MGYPNELRLGAIYTTVCAILLCGSTSTACPFCVALEPTLVQQREAAAVVALGELRETASTESRFLIHHVASGNELMARRQEITIPGAVQGEPGSLFVLFGQSSALSSEPLEWHTLHVTETSWGYVLHAPGMRLPTRERLPYFARHLEHPEPLIAADAIMEFAHAPYEDVVAVADALPSESLRQWIGDDRVPDERKGFYGLALGLARNDQDRQANEQVLQALIEQPADDFRAGFDGILGGYLVLKGTPGLERIESKFLSNARAADGNVRHAMSALRFYYEYGRDIPRERLHVALRHLLDRPEFAAAAIIDLARWQDWEVMPRVARLFDSGESTAPATRRAVVGYLLACPVDAARLELGRLRTLYPQEVAATEQRLLLPGGAF